MKTNTNACAIRGKFMLGETSSGDSKEVLHNLKSSQEKRNVSKRSHAETRLK